MKISACFFYFAIHYSETGWKSLSMALILYHLFYNEKRSELCYLNYLLLLQNQALHGKSKSIVQRAIKLQLVLFPKKVATNNSINGGHTQHNSCTANFRPEIKGVTLTVRRYSIQMAYCKRSFVCRHIFGFQANENHSFDMN